MITVVSGTNRSENLSIKVAKAVVELLTTNDIEVQLLDLQQLPIDFVFRNDVFGNPDPGFSAISEQFIGTADQFVFVIPEYNGSYPGVCKAFIDSIWPEFFKGKKAALIGLSSGRTGNVRGCDQLTTVLNYLGVTTHPNPVHLHHIEGQLNENGDFEEEKSLQRIAQMLANF
jgi:chromate reductase, NAD(P)H dehydrogenase (quinone)